MLAPSRFTRFARFARFALFAPLVLGSAACNDSSKPAATGAAPRALDVLAHGQKSSRAHEWVRSLTDEVGARPAGSPNDARAVAWAERTMRAIGLVNVHVEPVRVPHWVRGSESAVVVDSAAVAEHHLSLTALGGSVGTPEEGIEAEVVAAKSLEELDKLPDDVVKGKIVFIDAVTPRTKTGEGYGKTVGIRAFGASAAAKKGAVAFLLRSVATGPARLPHTGAMRYLDDAPKIPAAALAVPDAELLRRLVDAKTPVRVKLHLGCKLEAEGSSANVVGDVVGREKPEEIFVMGAHLDSWDLGTGALDDGAGVGAVLDAGRAILALPTRPRRTVRVVLFANEEFGLSGGKDYVRVHEAELSRHVGAVELDVGGGRVLALAHLIGNGTEKGLPALASALGPLGVSVLHPAEHVGSDIGPLRFAGVPVFNLDQDATSYFDHHHSADDTYDKIDPRSLGQASTATAVLAFAVADLDADFGRVPEDKRGKKWW